MFSQALSKVLSLVFISAVLVPNPPALANEGAPEGKKTESAPAAEEGAGGAASGEREDAQKKQLSEAQELQTKVQALQAKIRSKEETINKLIQEKNHTKDPSRVQAIIAEMVTEHKDLSKMVVEYEQIRSLLRYRYPEKGYSGSRAYERMEVKPLDQMEAQMSIEAKLKRNLETVRSQYGEPGEGGMKKKKSVQKKEAEAPSLTEPIILQK